MKKIKVFRQSDMPEDVRKIWDRDFGCGYHKYTDEEQEEFTVIHILNEKMAIEYERKSLMDWFIDNGAKVDERVLVEDI